MKCALLLFGSVTVALCALTVAVAFADPDCDGSNPTNGYCGTYTPCQFQDPPTIGDPPDCVGNEIFRVSGSFACTTPPGEGSTLCGDVTVSPAIPCTTKKPCTLVIDVALNPPRSWCEGQGAATTNSTTTTKKDNLVCNDTSGG